MVDLTGLEVSFILKHGTTVIKQDVTNTPGSNGAVEYQPIADDVATAGDYKQEWEVVFADGKILTFPNDGYNTVHILPDLG